MKAAFNHKEADIQCWDRYDRPAGSDNGRQQVMCQQTIPGGTTKTVEWGLHSHLTADRIVVSLKTVRLADKKTWTADKETLRVEAKSRR